MPLARRLLILLTLCCGSLASQSVLGQSADETASGDNEAQDAKPDEPQRYIISTDQSDEALAKLRPDQATWLETRSHGRVLALLEREHRSPAKGAVIVVGDVGQTADTGLAGALREPLAEASWAAMSLGLPQPPEKLMQWREDGARDSSGMSSGGDSEKESDGAKPGKASAVIDVVAKEGVAQMREAYESKLMDHLAAAEQKLRSSGYSPLVFVGIGRGADAVAAWSLGQGGGALMVWVVPELSEKRLDALTADGAGAESVILDLASAQSSDKQATERRSRLRRRKAANYQQQMLAIPARPQAIDANEIAHRITGWVSREPTRQ